MQTKRLLIILSSALILLNFTACKKYPEGPKFTVLPKKIRAANTWKSEAILKNGSDITTTNESHCNFDIDKSAYFDDSNGFSYSGTWKFQNDKKEILFTPYDAMYESRTFNLLKLKESKLWFSEVINGDTYEYHYVSAYKNMSLLN